jgi:hypothetical protein
VGLSFCQTPLNLPEDAGAAILHEVEDMLEAGIAAIVGVGDFAVLVLGTEFAEEADFGIVQTLRVQGAEISSVLIIHDEDEVMLSEIGSGDLTSEVAEIITTLGGGFSHARVSMLPRVPASSARGVDVDAVLPASVFDHAMHDAIGSRGAADVAEADEEELEVGHQKVSGRARLVDLVLS